VLTSDPSWLLTQINLVIAGTMIPSIIGYIILLVLLLVLSAFFSATETSFSSLNVIRIKQMSRSTKSYRKRAKKVYEIAKDYAQLISTVLVCNNIVNITLSSIVTYLFITLLKMQESGVLIATILTSIVIIIFGEIIPKNIAKLAPEQVALLVVNPMRVFIFIFKPITIIFSKLNDKMEERIPVEENVTATESELLEIVETIEREGVLEQDESELIQSAITFDSKSVRSVMTPKEKVVFIYSDITFSELVETFKKHKYTRIPVMNRETKKITGIIYQQDVFECLANNQTKSIDKLTRKAMYVSHRRLLPHALEKVQRNKAHLAVVVDNLREKNFLGVITLEDMLEELVGEIYDEYDDLPSEVVEIGHHIFDVAGSTRLENLFGNYLDESLPRTKAVTVGTWVKSLFKGKISKDAETSYQNLEIKITDCDESTVKRVEINQLTKLEDD